MSDDTAQGAPPVWRGAYCLEQATAPYAPLQAASPLLDRAAPRGRAVPLRMASLGSRAQLRGAALPLSCRPGQARPPPRSAVRVRANWLDDDEDEAQQPSAAAVAVEAPPAAALEEQPTASALSAPSASMPLAAAPPPPPPPPPPPAVEAPAP